MSRLAVAVDAFAHGKPVVIMDDTDRENEGDLCLPASCVTDEDVLFFLKSSTGILCVACCPLRIDELALPPMIQNNTDPNKTPFTVSVDLIPAHGVTTGVSVADKCKTIRALADPSMKATDFSRPGHIYPLRASPKGLFGRQGHTESSVELCRLAKMYPVCLIAELMNPDGTMSRLKECTEFCAKYNIPFVTVKEIQEGLYLRPAALPVKIGSEIANCEISTYHVKESGESCVILSKGDLKGKRDVPLRIHSECLTGDVFKSARCDCGSQLNRSIELLSKSECGVLIYIRGQEGRGIGLDNKIMAYALQDTGKFDTCTANVELGLPLDCRRYDYIPEILARLGIESVNLLSDNPDKARCLGPYLSKFTSFSGEKTVYNQDYMLVKSQLHNRVRPRSKVGIAYTTSWHQDSVSHMVKECYSYLHGKAVILERPVSGSFELVMGASQLFDQGCDSVIVIGILKKGETHHFEAIVSAVTQGVMSLQLEKKKPIVYGVLTCYTTEQIMDRVFGEKNAVKEWCKAALDMIK